jgi:hypothetical protein
MQESPMTVPGSFAGGGLDPYFIRGGETLQMAATMTGDTFNNLTAGQLVGSVLFLLL